MFTYIHIYIYTNHHSNIFPQDQADPLVLEIRTPNLGSRMVSHHKNKGF